ncbi:MAG TPA: methanogenesis marker 6 protein [Methanoregulaceae archaeon]|nr:MAG: methanogenesis marker 6 protein [Methanolinea sp.]HON80675.1 methanogenesis marker 6 protein [Methanoregulaceae archaeon]HPD09409.1 methanogenesis marker 6 protein [Methanoregulaceae archaeon]HRT14798.1 methanogenesis marker 6 protein [Methanoregulaceae archaeon]HRU30371.1 methanogenesis marker 6 protein [Methanoregulaceae archaeon]
MKEYMPKYVGTVTKYVFVESPDMTPADLAIRAYEISQGVMIKETCFGLQITGRPEDVDRIIARLRTLDPSHIFVKDRGFPPGDPRRCRANLGGARPGYYGHEFEISLIRHISRGIEELPRRDADAPVHPPVSAGPSKLDARRLQEIITSQEP